MPTKRYMGRPRKKPIEEVLDANGLTPEQEAFCRARAAGQTAPQAYRTANPDKSEGYSYKAGKELDDMEKIRIRIQSLRDQLSENLIVELEEIKADLTRIATDPTRPDGVRLKAYDQITRMLGGYDDRLNVSGEFGFKEREDALSDLLDG